jgi:hypothetical protein
MLPLSTKLTAIRDFENGVSQVQLAKKYGVAQGTISMWVKKKGQIEAAAARGESLATGRLPQLNHNFNGDRYPLVNRYMIQYIQEHQKTPSARGQHCWRKLREAAELYANELVEQGHAEYESFRASPGWLQNLLSRYHHTGDSHPNVSQADDSTATGTAAVAEDCALLLGPDLGDSWLPSSPPSLSLRSPQRYASTEPHLGM